MVFGSVYQLAFETDGSVCRKLAQLPTTNITGQYGVNSCQRHSVTHSFLTRKTLQTFFAVLSLSTRPGRRDECNAVSVLFHAGGKFCCGSRAPRTPTPRFSQARPRKLCLAIRVHRWRVTLFLHMAGYGAADLQSCADPALAVSVCDRLFFVSDYLRSVGHDISVQVVSTT
jgi:hypothetical protein